MARVDVPRDAPLYAVGTVRQLTGLTDRQIRYYGERGLVVPARSRGNQRLYSQTDVDALEEVKRLLAEGRRIGEVKKALIERKSAQGGTREDLIRSSDAMARFGETVSLRSIHPFANRPEFLKTLDSLSERNAGRK
ncbi:MAG: MerR family transcriptional regulator [Bacillota bacterium]